MHRRYEPNNIPIEILRSFVSILDSGSFTKAAESLNITQPAISAQIKRMQTLVGEELFEKVGGGISLTEKGEMVSRYARRILALNDQILQSGRCDRKFRIGLPSTLAGQYLKELQDALTAANFLSVQVVCERSDVLLKRLGSGLFDVVLAFTGSPGDQAPVVQWEEPLVWACHPDFLLSPGAPLPLMSWPSSVPDHIAIKACEQAQMAYTVEFASNELIALFEALHLKLGYLCIAERSVPRGMKIAKEFFLPALPPMHAGLYTNTDVVDARLGSLVKCLSRVLRPSSVTSEPPEDGAKVKDEAIREAPGASAGRICAPPRLTASAAQFALRARRYHDKADEARQLAEIATAEPRRASLLSIAESYEATAKQFDAVSAGPSAKKKTG